jgi:hypothetical protein
MNNNIRSLEFSLPVHLDYTTIYGAARAVEESEIKKGRLPFARLLALSQLVEAIVIHDQLQYELGTSPDWEPYQEALHSTRLMRSIKELDIPLYAYTEQVDAEDCLVLNAAHWATEKALNVPITPLLWAVRFRSGTYDDISNILDIKNPMLDRFITIIKNSGDSNLFQNFNAAMGRLSDNHVGPLGFHVLMRARLLENHLIEQNIANYLPHFSRQPLIVALQDKTAEIKRWSINLIRTRRNELLAGNEPTQDDDLSVNLSPIFLACLAKAKNPAEIIDRALELRHSKEACEYRRECREVSSLNFYGEEELVQVYKLRVRKKLQALQVALKGEDCREEYVSQCGVRRAFLNFFFFSTVRRTTRPATKERGDNSAVFLNKILFHSMGVISSQERIRDIYGLAVNYDSDVLAWKE